MPSISRPWERSQSRETAPLRCTAALLMTYRLRQTDCCATFTFSDTVAVQIGGAPGFYLDYGYRSELGVVLGYRVMSPYPAAEIYGLTGKRLFGDILENVEGRSVIYPEYYGKNFLGISRPADNLTLA
jgi:hypothetical protein